jgi:hypothetical protein
MLELTGEAQKEAFAIQPSDELDPQRQVVGCPVERQADRGAAGHIRQLGVGHPAEVSLDHLIDDAGQLHQPRRTRRQQPLSNFPQRGGDVERANRDGRFAERGRHEQVVTGVKIGQARDELTSALFSPLKFDAPNRAAECGHHTGVLLERVIARAGFPLDSLNLDRLMHEPDRLEVAGELRIVVRRLCLLNLVAQFAQQRGGVLDGADGLGVRISANCRAGGEPDGVRCRRDRRARARGQR